MDETKQSLNNKILKKRKIKLKSKNFQFKYRYIHHQQQLLDQLHNWI